MGDPFSKIDKLLRKAITRGRFPSAAYLLGGRGQVIICQALGNAVMVPEKIPATTGTIYDIASLTKVLVTTTLVIRAREQGLLSLSDRVARFLPEFENPEKEGVTIEQLLTHTAGFPTWRPIYAAIQDRAQTAEYLARLPLDSPAGTKVAYSDLGFITLTVVLERIYQMSFGELARREIFEPLGLTRTFFNPPRARQREIAGGEVSMDREREDARPWGSQVDELPMWRRGFVWGEMQDGNGYFLGGAVGHGGLFSTLEETYAMARQFLPGSQLIPTESLSLFSRNFTVGLNRNRSLGWMLASTDGCAAGSALPPDAFGHTGFTGTSLWIDPQRQRVYVLLTNRTHPKVTDFDMNGLRQQFHQFASRALDKM